MDIIIYVMDHVLQIYKKILSLNKFENFIKKYKKNIVFVCVGNFDVWYDSFGPIVGSILKFKYNIPCFIYGTIEHNIKLDSLNLFIDWIKNKHFNSKIIVIDAALSSDSLIRDNHVRFYPGKTKCAYFCNDVDSFGHFSILCPVRDKDEDIKCNFKIIIENALLVSSIISQIIN